ncbi:MAG: phosphoribosyltransferase, partial [Candidatus Helarchaeota archaeon]|nr:phosphoribosyltransferase [Candidatus Helarchaeota archaeon]
MDYIYFNWSKIYFQCLELAKKIKTDGFFPDLILGLARGGLIIARLLSDFLKVKEILTLQLESYKTLNQKKSSPKLINDISCSVNNKKILLCDDLVDTGETMVYITNYIKNKGCNNMKVATLHKKPHSKFTPDFYIQEVNAWIIYPWELQEFITALQKSKKNITDIEEELSKLEVEN